MNQSDMMQIVLFSCLCVSAVSLKLATISLAATDEPRVAGIVAIHPPKFDMFYDFMRDWASCPEGREAMELMPIFSSQSDADAFVRGLQVREINTDIFTPLVAQSLPEGATA